MVFSRVKAVGESVIAGAREGGWRQVVPDLVDRRVEDRLGRGGSDDPRSGGKLAFELVRSPAGIPREDTEPCRLLVLVQLADALKAFGITDVNAGDYFRSSLFFGRRPFGM